MSSSASPVPDVRGQAAESEATTQPAIQSSVKVSIQPFPYDAIAPGAAPHAGLGVFSVGMMAGQDAEQASATTQARLQGRQQGQAEAQAAFERQLTKERDHLATAVAGFSRDRAGYFRKVEGEVVKLALAIARKILHREAQVDPMLLAGLVRVTLEKIDAATEIVLRVHPLHAAEWKQYLALHLEPQQQPEIVEDPGLAPDTCVLQTSMGTALLGTEVQLKEIEQGLMDLLAARPGGSL
ncbi:MAG TPA: FliH/SctL family protein [Candidatus Solibacter sp.]|nr:FliH/SctL family protein [Candidatus Solibacter sp.]